MEVPFDVKIKRLDEWFNYNEWLMLKNEDYGRVEIWKRQVYNIQLDAARALSEAHYSLTPCDSDDSEVIRNDDQIVFDPKVVKSAFYLRYCILLLQGSGDKLAQIIRCALGITHWLKIDGGKKKAKENNTTLQGLPDQLDLLIKYPELPKQEKLRYQEIFKELKKYLADESVKKILYYANAIKHRWQLYYQGEGLQPLRPEIIVTKNKGGKIIREFPTGASALGEDINKHICLCLKTNNMFVDIANAIHHHLDPNRFYTDKNGKKILEVGVKKG